MAFFTSAGIAAALGIGSGFLSTVSAIALNAAVGIGLQLAVTALQPKPKGAEPLAVQGKLQSGGDVARSIILGRRATAGSLVYANTWGKASKTPNAYFTQVIALSDVPVSQLTAMWVNSEPVTVNTSDTTYADTYGYPVTEYRKGSTPYLWVKFYDGTQDEADPFLIQHVSSSARPYESTRVGKGIAYAIVTSRSNPELFSGFPAFRFEVQGMPLYDISKDSTAGGNGAHRWADPSTWGGDGDDLPVVQVYNIERGIRYAGDWIYGLQNAPAARFPAADWIAQINKCRTLVDGADGPEPQYRTGAEISVDAEIGSSIETILMGCHGRPIETGGIYKVRVGEPGAAVMVITDDDIISTDEQTFKPFFGLNESINGITASYPEPAEAWNTKAAPALYSPQYEARDGNRRLVSDLDLTAVSVARQVQQIMRAALAEARRERRHTIPLPPKFWALEPGDVIEWTSVRNGYQAKLMRIDGIGDQANLDIIVDMTEVDPTDYDFNYFTDYTPPVFVPVSPGRPEAQPMSGWQAGPATIYDEDGVARRPSIKVSCDEDQDDVVRVWVQVRLASTGAVVFDSDSTPYAAPFEWILNGNFLPATEYQVRGRYVPYTARVTEWSSWIEVLTPNVKLVPGRDFDPYSGVVGLDQLGDDIKGYQDWLADGRRELFERMDSIALLVADQDLANTYVHQQIRQQLTATRDNITASYLKQVDVLATADQALALSIDQLEASVFDPTTGLPSVATAVSALTTRVSTAEGSITSIADQVTSLSAQVGNVDSSVNVRASAVAGGADGYSRYAIQVKTSDGAWSAQAGLYLETKVNALSRIILDAQQLFFGDLSSDAGLLNPLVYSGGKWRSQAQDIGVVTAGLIQSPNGKMVIDATQGTIVINS